MVQIIWNVDIGCSYLYGFVKVFVKVPEALLKDLFQMRDKEDWDKWMIKQLIPSCLGDNYFPLWTAGVTKKKAYTGGSKQTFFFHLDYFSYKEITILEKEIFGTTVFTDRKLIITHTQTNKHRN